MSLVGSLDDLGLGDILQIVSMARKSGLLVLRSTSGEGRILFRDGMVRAAFAKGEPDDLRGLLVGGGFVSDEDFERATELARSSGCSLDEAVAEQTSLKPERLASLRREHVERAVVRMFTWSSGEFTFDVREEVDARDAELLLPQGLNTQYLAMEATRLSDESLREDNPDADAGDDWGAPGALALAALENAEAEAAEPDSTGTAVPEADRRPVAGLIAIDPDLDALEWMKTALTDSFPRIHIFQRCESGIDRIRQYLGRGDLPAVLLSAEAHADPAIAADGLGVLVARLRSHAPHMPIIVIHEDPDGPPTGADAADAVLTRPTTARLMARSAARKREEAAQKLREQLQPWAERCVRAEASQPDRAKSAGAVEAASAGPRAPSTRIDVLNRVLEFAAETFSRVAMFMLRDDEAVGIAQVGLARAGGPGDEQIRELTVDSRGPCWFRTVTETRQALRSPPVDESDFQLVGRLGTAAPSEAYVAPIESGGRVVALLYADNLPDDTPVGDTTALEIVLEEAGTALDRTGAEAEVEPGKDPQDR